MNIWTQDNACDYGHYADEIRRLPIGEDATIYVCWKHYHEEISGWDKGRFDKMKELGRETTWIKLPVKGREE